ncbi:hypothetical protein GCM10023079_14010 [Streptomyces chitinivorans]
MPPSGFPGGGSAPCRCAWAPFRGHVTEPPAAKREQVLSRIMRVLPETVEIDAGITVRLARRRYER